MLLDRAGAVADNEDERKAAVLELAASTFWTERKFCRKTSHIRSFGKEYDVV